MNKESLKKEIEKIIAKWRHKNYSDEWIADEIIDCIPSDVPITSDTKPIKICELFDIYCPNCNQRYLSNHAHICYEDTKAYK